MLLPAGSARAQGGVDDPAGTGGVVVNYKTPPLRQTETIPIHVSYHVNQFIPNWAGLRVGVHLLDNTELDIDSITGPTGITMIPPSASCSLRAGGTSGGAAVTMILS